MHGVFPRCVEDINSVKRFGKHFQQACLLNTFPLCKVVLGFHLTGLCPSGLFNMNSVVLLKNQNCSFNVFFNSLYKNEKQRQSVLTVSPPEDGRNLETTHTRTHRMQLDKCCCCFCTVFRFFFFFLILTQTWEEVVGGDENTIIYILLHKKKSPIRLLKRKALAL